MNFSIIIPLYNRPQEISELLESLTKQTVKNFDVIVVEDGSQEKSNEIIKKYSNKLDIKYYQKENVHSYQEKELVKGLQEES